MAHDEADGNRRPSRERDWRAPREQVRDEHERLMPLINGLAECVEGGGLADASWLGSVRGRLETLREALLAHFHEEETGPFGPHLPPGCPHLAGRVSELLAQHPVILKSVDTALATCCGVGPDDMGARDELKGSVHLLIAIIRRHEAAENELILDAVWDDYGGGD